MSSVTGSQWVRVVVVLGLAGALVGVVPDGVSAAPARARCRPTAFVANDLGDTVSTIDVKTRTKHPDDIAVAAHPGGMVVTPDDKTVFLANAYSNTVSTIDVKTRIKVGTDIPVGSLPFSLGVTPDGKTVFVANFGDGTVSTIDLKTRTKEPTDIPVGPGPISMAITPDGKTGFVDNFGGPLMSAESPTPGTGTVSTIDVKTRTKHPADITVGAQPAGPAITPDGKTVFVANYGNGTVSTIDVKTRTKHPTDIPVGPGPTTTVITPCRR